MQYITIIIYLVKIYYYKLTFFNLSNLLGLVFYVLITSKFLSDLFHTLSQQNMITNTFLFCFLKKKTFFPCICVQMIWLHVVNMHSVQMKNTWFIYNFFFLAFLPCESSDTWIGLQWCVFPCDSSICMVYIIS